MSVIQSFKAGGDSLSYFFWINKKIRIWRDKVESAHWYFLTFLYFYFTLISLPLSPLFLLSALKFSLLKRKKKSTVSRNCFVPYSLMKSLIKWKVKQFINNQFCSNFILLAYTYCLSTINGKKYLDLKPSHFQ